MSSFKINENFVLALDIVACRGKPPVLFVVDKETRGCSSHELGADITADIIQALTHEIEIVEELPVAIETDNGVSFSTLPLHEWLCERGIEHRRPSAGKPHHRSVVEALIRQKLNNRGDQ